MPCLRLLLRYVRWWVADIGDNRILFTGPLYLVGGTIGVVGALVATDFEYLLVAAAGLVLGLTFTVGPGLRYWGKLKPWDQYPGTDSY